MKSNISRKLPLTTLNTPVPFEQFIASSMLLWFRETRERRPHTQTSPPGTGLALKLQWFA